MRRLEDMLQTIPAVYVDLVDAALPQRVGEQQERRGGRDPREKPAPGDLSTIEHRHELVRGLRWWVDAVENDSRARVGQSVPAMCALLLSRLQVMAEDDLAQMRINLHVWLNRAWSMLDRTPREAGETLLDRVPMDQSVRVADAATLLGCTVRTIQRRVPLEHRPAGMLELWRALPDCPVCDLKVGAGCAC